MFSINAFLYVCGCVSNLCAPVRTIVAIIVGALWLVEFHGLNRKIDLKDNEEICRVNHHLLQISTRSIRICPPSQRRPIHLQVV